MTTEPNFDDEFWKIAEETQNRDRIARGEPTHKELMRFIREEIESGPAPAGYSVHGSHRPQTAQDARENAEGGRYCMRCCCLVLGGHEAVTVRGMNVCPGKRTMVLGGDDRMHWQAGVE